MPSPPPEAQHTTGPYLIRGPAFADWRCIETAAGVHLACVDNKRSEGNADLFKAAPQLVEALEGLLGLVSEPAFDPAESYVQIEAARTALAATRGGGA